MSIDLRPYLALLDDRDDRKERRRKRIHLRRDIPYTPQDFTPEEGNL